MAKPYPINPVLQFVVKIWMTVFGWYYNISAKISKDLIDLDEPYLLLSNHYGRYDPFIVSNFIKKRPNFISSDAILRDKIIGTLFKGLGAMPKKKGMRDSHIIREMVKVIRSGGALALFPEGARTWSGETLYIDPSIAKLVKLLKVPIVTAKMQGAYAFDPRWAKPLRRAKVEIEFKLALNTEELKAFSEDEILSIILKNLYQDDVKYQRRKKIEIKSNRRAEHLDLILFQCPKCKNYEGFSSFGNQVECKECGYSIHVDKFGFFSDNSDERLSYDNPKDWLMWQNKNFVSYINKQLSSGLYEPLFKASGFKIQYAIGEGRMKTFGTGDILFYHDGLVIRLPESEEKLPYSDIDSFGPQFNERIELFYKDRAYRFTATQNREPGVKWELAVNVVWYRLGESHKLSPYFKELIKAEFARIGAN